MKSAPTTLIVLTAALCTSCSTVPATSDVHCNVDVVDPETTVVPSTCTSGRISWDWPQGTLSLTFTQTRPFTVCLAPDIGPAVGGLHQVINGQIVDVDNPQEFGEDVCLKGDTAVQVLLDAPEFQAYMTYYSFKIHFDE